MEAMGLRRRRLALSVAGVAIALACLVPVLRPAAADAAAQYVPDRVLVRFAEGTPARAVTQVLAGVGGESTAVVPALDLHVVEIESRPEGTAITELERSPWVEYAERDVVVTWFDRIPNDVRWPEQWGIRTIRGPRAWDGPVGAEGVVIAVLDTGVAAGHADLRGALVPGFDFVNGDADPADDQGHGTSAAGVAGARSNNAEGIAGMCWECRLMPVKVLGADGNGTTASVAAGIAWAVSNGADVITMSLGGPATTRTLEDAVNTAAAKGVLLVAAAGNQGSTAPTYPAAHDEVLSVAATDTSDRLYGWSNRGLWVDVAAPGCNLAPVYTGGYGTFCGTSSATPLAAGVAGLALSASPGATAAEVRAAIESTAVPIGGDVRHGRIDAAAAVGRFVTLPSLVSPPPPPPGSPAPPPAPAPSPQGPQTAPPAEGEAIPPVPSRILPALPVQNGRTFTVAWGASGVASFEIRRRVALGPGRFGPYEVVRAGTTGTTLRVTHAPGVTSCYSARGRSALGARGPWGAEACTAVPLDDRALRRVGPWRLVRSSGAYLGTELATARRGAALVRRVSARRLALVATRCPRCGTVKVSLGGRVLRTVSLQATRTRRKQVIPVGRFRALRTGVLRIEVVSAGRQVRLDGLGPAAR